MKFFYLKYRLNSNGESEAAVAAKTRIGRTNFKECLEFALWEKVIVED